MCLLIGGSGVGYVWQKNQIYDLARQTKQLETRRDILRHQNRMLENLLAKMSSPKELDARVKNSNLGLVPPRQDKVWRLVETPMEHSSTAAEGRFVAR
ncbi:MAG: hypothetical protein ABI651_19855 [Verrucomicrobiota bacterium]